jgi:thiamine transport system substrate-binding protein
MKRLATLAVALAVVASACGRGGTPSEDPASSFRTPPPQAPATDGTAGLPELVVMAHDSFALSEDLLAAFEAEHRVRLRLLASGDTGQMVNQAILAGDDPLADVLYGVDTTFLSRALDAELFTPYAPAALAAVPDAFEVDPRRRVTPVDYGDVCLNYDREAFAPGGLPLPETLDDLTDPQYAGTLVVEDPSTSSPGLAFLLSTVATFGEDPSAGWRAYWSALRDNDVEVASDWESAYYGSFSGGTGEGDRPLVVSYASSPPAEVYFGESPTDEPATGVIVDGCFRQVEYAGILTGTDQEPLARAFIDFLLTREVQEDLPLSMFVFPVLPDAALPEVFELHAAVPESPVSMPVELIGANRDRWIEEWTETVLR